MVIPLCVGILEGFLQAIWEVLGANTISYKMFMAQFLGFFVDPLSTYNNLPVTC